MLVYCLVLIYISFIFCACSDYLEIEPKSEVNIETLSLKNKSDIDFN